ncbi:MAG: hypothetical protein WCK96_17040 [Methylococcales bacterium]
MKTNRKFWVCATMACAVWASTTMAATEQQKLDAINNGLANLQSTQQAGGYWNYGGFEPAATGASVLAFVSQKDKWGANAANYQTAVDNAVNYLLSTATKVTVSTRNDGVNICPSGSGSCDAVYWDAYANEDSYTTGLIIPALVTYAAGKANVVATTTGPLKDMTWGQIIQANTNLWAASQSTANQGNRIGGWRYILGQSIYDSDMSTTQWGIISLIYNQSFGATTPQIVKDDLKQWLAVAQDSGSGAGCYQPGVYCDHSDTGGLLLGLNFVGKTTSDDEVKKALIFLNTNWTQTANGIWFGNFGHPYAMWSVYKGLEVNIGLNDNTHITTLKTDCGASSSNLPGNPAGSKPCNWWEDYNDWLVNNQNPDGSWTGYDYWYGPLATAFYVNILGATQIPVDIPVPLDIHPTSCPNPINTNSNGIVPVAILGTKDLDVTKIDPTTIKLINPSLTNPLPVSPIRWTLENVATPYTGNLVDAFSCNTSGPDGYVDLTLKFDTKKLIAALGNVSNRAVLKLQVTGKLKAEFGGTPIKGEDIVLIIKNK